MENKDPLVSVLITTYNRKNLLKNCLDSITLQTYKNLQIILIDDASTDGTFEMFEETFKQDKRIEYIRRKKNTVQFGGEEDNFRLSHSLKKGDYFINMGDDDYWVDLDYINKAIKIFQKYPEIGKVIGSQVNRYYEDFYERISIDDLKKELDNKSEQYFHHSEILPSGYIEGKEYLELFAKNPLSINISTIGTLFSTEKFENSMSLQTKEMSLAQAGFELFIPTSFISDVYYINTPCSISGLKSSNMSFGRTQRFHMYDQLKSINNAFENISKVKNMKIDELYLIDKIKKPMSINVLIAYLHHSITIFRTGQLGLCTKENIKGYVNLFDALKILIKLRSFYKIYDILKISIYYTYFKLFKKKI